MYDSSWNNIQTSAGPHKTAPNQDLHCLLIHFSWNNDGNYYTPSCWSLCTTVHLASEVCVLLSWNTVHLAAKVCVYLVGIHCLFSHFSWRRVNIVYLPDGSLCTVHLLMGLCIHSFHRYFCEIFALNIILLYAVECTHSWKSLCTTLIKMCRHSHFSWSRWILYT